MRVISFIKEPKTIDGTIHMKKLKAIKWQRYGDSNPGLMAENHPS
jgi:hypothetical protein